MTESGRSPAQGPASIGPYTILGELGRGGMGTVYRARDTRLGRDVALKVLPEDLHLSPERLARFGHEARILAALNHPNIAAIYGVEDGDAGVQALVLELVEGTTLATRVAGGRLSIADALAIARQIAEALDEAHEKGVVHRDLKPANIVITPAGLVKVLDFGIAKMTTPDGPMSGDTVTGDGVIVGTPAYMSPEQARGQAVDKRTDVWAFGCVLYEMLTGTRAFTGPSATDTLAAIVDREPDWSLLPAAAPPTVVTLLHRSLDKNRTRRLRDIGEARIALEASGAGPHAPAIDRSWFTPRSFRTASVLLVALLASSYAAWSWRTPRTGADEARAPSRTVFTLEPPPGEEFGTSGDEEPVPVASPDSTKLLFRTGGRVAPRWWIKSVDSETLAPLDAALGAQFVWWAPDSRQVLWCTRNTAGASELRAAPLAGGARRLAGGCHPGRGASWGSAGVIIFAAEDSRTLRRVPEGGGDSSPLTELDPSHPPERRVAWPALLPDGRHFVFLVTGPASTDQGIFLGAIGSTTYGRLAPERSRPVVVPRADGGVDLVFVQRRKLIAQQLDVGAAKLVGEPEVLAPDVSMGLTSFTGAYTASPSLLAYRAGGHTSDASGLQWFDRRGTAVGAVDTGKGLIASLSLRGDGRRVLFAKFDPDADTISIWDHDLESHISQLVRHDDRNYLSYGEPAFAPDGQSFIYMSNETGNWTIHEFWPETRRDETLAPGTVQQYPSAERVLGADTGYFILNRADRSRTPLPLPAGARQPRVSPDGRSVAFSWTGASQSGTAYDIYIQLLPAGVPVRLSTNGGFDPEWSRDGRELDYLTPDGYLVAARVDPRDPTRRGQQERLFQVKKPTNDPLQPSVIGLSHFAPSADGQRFLMIPFRAQQKVTVVRNWRQP